MIRAFLAQVPDVTPQAPPGLEGPAAQFLGWLMWGAIIAGVGGLIWIGIGMVVGRRNRSAYAADSAQGIPWVFAGLSIVVLAGGLVGQIMT